MHRYDSEFIGHGFQLIEVSADGPYGPFVENVTSFYKVEQDTMRLTSGQGLTGRPTDYFLHNEVEVVAEPSEELQPEAGPALAAWRSPCLTVLNDLNT